MTKSPEDEMLEALGVDTSPEEIRQYTRQEERLIAGFEDIQRFVEQHGRPPRHGEDLDIFERIYAVRLDRLSRLPEARKLLAPMDSEGILGDRRRDRNPSDPEDMNEDVLLAELGAGGDDDITVLRHVKPHARKRTAEEVAARQSCTNFERFQSLFAKAEEELASGLRETVRFGRDTSIEASSYPTNDIPLRWCV